MPNTNVMLVAIFIIEVPVAYLSSVVSYRILFYRNLVVNCCYSSSEKGKTTEETYEGYLSVDYRS